MEKLANNNVVVHLSTAFQIDEEDWLSRKIVQYGIGGIGFVLVSVNSYRKSNHTR